MNKPFKKKIYKCYDCRHETDKPKIYRNDLYICPICNGIVGYIWVSKKYKIKNI